MVADSQSPRLISEHARGSRVRRAIVSLSVFAIAMAYLEAALVVYLRKLYYPEGFGFPLESMDRGIVAIEYMRELSTLLMLGAVGYLTGRNFASRFGAFLFVFGLWDIFYYIWLKVLLDWPSSLLTWDILFLIPVVWVGPVLAPAICALTMILLGAWVLFRDESGQDSALRPREWGLLVLGSCAIVVAFIWDYSTLAAQALAAGSSSWTGTEATFMDAVSDYVPASFHWATFSFGEALILCAVGFYIRRGPAMRAA